jgi:lysophospholipase L1-like esterase
MRRFLSRRWWLVAALVSALLLLAGVEGVFRLHTYRKEGTSLLPPLALRDRFVGWRNNPAYGRPNVQHNAQGFRRRADVALPKPPTTARVFFLGGSTAYGAGGSYPHIDDRYLRITNDQLIDAYLEERLNRAFPARRWEVINAASSGYRIHQQLALIESVILKYAPDYVVLMDGYNDVITLCNHVRRGTVSAFDVYDTTPDADDFDALANPGSLRSLFVFTRYWLRRHSAAVRGLQDRLHEITVTRWRSESAATDLSLTPARRAAVAAAVDKAGYFTRIARQIHRTLEVSGVPAVFLLQPELVLTRKPMGDTEARLAAYDRSIGGAIHSYCFEQLHAALAQEMTRAAATEGFRFLNLLDVFDGTAEQAFTDFAHLTPAGNASVAERLFRVLADTLLPPGPPPASSARRVRRRGEAGARAKPRAAPAVWRGAARRLGRRDIREQGLQSTTQWRARHETSP